MAWLGNFFTIIKAQCTCFEVNFSQQARFFNDVLYNLWPMAAGGI